MTPSEQAQPWDIRTDEPTSDRDTWTDAENRVRQHLERTITNAIFPDDASKVHKAIDLFRDYVRRSALSAPDVLVTTRERAEEALREARWAGQYKAESRAPHGVEIVRYIELSKGHDRKARHLLGLEEA